MRCLPLILLTALLTGCGSIKNWRAQAAEKKAREEAAKKKDDPSPAIRTVGKIHFVDEGRGFVLIETIPGPRPENGAELEALSPEGSRARLRTSPEQKAQYMVAVILSGQPAAGQPVLTIAGTKTAPGPLSPINPVAADAAAFSSPGAPAELSPQMIPDDALPKTTLSEPGQAPFPDSGSGPAPDAPGPLQPLAPGDANPDRNPPPENETPPAPPDSELPLFR